MKYFTIFLIFAVVIGATSTRWTRARSLITRVAFTWSFLVTIGQLGHFLRSSVFSRLPLNLLHGLSALFAYLLDFLNTTRYPVALIPHRLESQLSLSPLSFCDWLVCLGESSLDTIKNRAYLFLVLFLQSGSWDVGLSHWHWVVYGKR